MKQPAFNFNTSSFSTLKPLSFYYGLLIIFCVLAYANTIPNQYGVDDYLVTNHNKLIEKGVSGLYEIFTTNYISEGDVHLDYRPLVKATFAIEYSLFGWNAHISHIINLLLYAFGCCIILKVLLELFGRQYFAIIFTGLLLYAVHPMHTEVVASLKSRDEILVMVFIFLSALFFIKYAGTKSTKHAALGFLFFVLSLLSKITGIPFIVLIPVMMFIKTREVKAPLAVMAVLALTTVAYYAALIGLLPGLARPYEYVETPLPYINDYTLKLGTAFYSLGYYIKLLVAPVQFSFYYGINYIKLQSLWSAMPLLSVGLHLLVLAAAIYSFRKNIFISFLLFFYLVQISLASNILQPLPGIVGERVLFVASLSFCLLLAWVLHRFLNAPAQEATAKKKEQSKTVKAAEQFEFTASKAQLAVLALILVFYGYQTFARNSQWKDTITLFEADMPHLTESAKANYMMAKEVRRLYRTDKDLTPPKLEAEAAKAIHYYNQAITAYPNYAIALEELGMIYAVELKNNSMAIPLFKRAYAADSTMWRSASNLGKAFQMSGDTTEAIDWYERSLHIKGDNTKALVELGKLYYLHGEKAKALATNDSLMVINPNSYLPYYNYGIYYMLEGDTTKAIQYFEEDIKRGEKEHFPYLFLIKHYLSQHDTANAVRVRNFVPRVSP